MSLQPGARLGPYEIVSALGAGGMGEVFRARDTRLGRIVAIKVLPAAWSQEPDRLRRFEQEARAVGSLSHPGLLVLHDVGTSDGMPYLVTELLEGETLRQRLDAAAISPRKAVEIGCQLARALAAAHDHGIVHRDLKPENVFITADGRAKILDFGLARLIDVVRPGSDAAIGETHLATDPGMVVGSLGYLSPEQARGLAVDSRTDIFALGAVIYEMLSGHRAFRGATPADAISAVVRDDPADLPPSVSPALALVVRRCMEKQPGERYQSAYDVALALEAVTTGSGIAPSGTSPVKLRRRVWPLAVTGVVGAVLTAWALGALAPAASSDSPVLRYEAYSGLDASPAVSADGRTLAFVSTRDGTSRVWLKQMINASEAVLSDGPDSYPRFHPDNASVLFIRRQGTQNALFRQNLLGGEPRRLATDVDEADWSPDGRRLVMIRRHDTEGARARTSLLVAAADGSQLRTVSTLDTLLTQPRWSPDGTRVAAAEFGLQSGSWRRMVIITIDTGQVQFLDTPLRRRRLSAPAWLEGGRRIVYAQAESVTADTAGSAARIYLHELDTNATRLLLWTPMNADVIDLAGDGSLIWDGLSSRANLRSINLAGGAASADRWLTRGQSNDRQPVFTPDGQWVVFSSNRTGNLDLWAISPVSGATRRLTDDAADDWDPGVTPDGRLIWSSTRSGHFEIWTANFDGSDARQVSNDGVDAENPTATPDGWVVYSSSNPEKRGIWKVRLDGSQASRLVVASVLVPDVSPDGQHVAATLQSLTAQVRVQVWRVADGSRVPFEIVLPGEALTFGVGRTRWMPDGKRLAFIGLDARGVRGIYVQDFVPGRDTTATRKPIGAFDVDVRTESFGISPDGARMVVTGADQLRTILRADGLAAVKRPKGN